MDKQFMTVEQAALYLHCSTRTVERYLAKGLIPRARIGRRCLIPAGAMAALLRDQTT